MQANEKNTLSKAPSDYLQKKETPSWHGHKRNTILADVHNDLVRHLAHISDLSNDNALLRERGLWKVSSRERGLWRVVIADDARLCKTLREWKGVIEVMKANAEEQQKSMRRWDVDGPPKNEDPQPSIRVSERPSVMDDSHQKRVERQHVELLNLDEQHAIFVAIRAHSADMLKTVLDCTRMRATWNEAAIVRSKEPGISIESNMRRLPTPEGSTFDMDLFAIDTHCYDISTKQTENFKVDIHGACFAARTTFAPGLQITTKIYVMTNATPKLGRQTEFAFGPLPEVRNDLASIAARRNHGTFTLEDIEERKQYNIPAQTYATPTAYA